MKVHWVILFGLLACDRTGITLDSTDTTEDTSTRVGDSSIDTHTDTATDSLCDEDVEIFETHVWAPVLERYCTGCHVADGMASFTDMVLDPDDMLHNLRQVSPVADRLLTKPTGLHENGHTGGALVVPDTEEWAALEFWVDWTEGICEEPETVCGDTPLPRRLWRIDHDQYKDTITDLLGITTVLSRDFAPDTHVDGYANDADALLVTGLLADHYRETAEILGGAADIVELLDCVPEEGAITLCAATGIEGFGLRAFRRPLTEAELNRYLTLWAVIAEESGFYEGLRWVVTAMLQSPHFLYRSELGIDNGDGTYTLTDWEVASELSYLLWGTMPDEELLAAAEAGELHTTEQIEAQLLRMMGDDRALDTVADFFDAWLQLDQIQTVSRDDLDADLRDAMAEQTHETVTELAREDATLADLMTGTGTWMPAYLASHYGTEETGWIEQDGVQYGGLLTHGSVLTTYALSDGSSPVHRGVLVRERMLCEELPPPPPNLDTSPPATDAAGTTREKYEIHASLPECASCHALIDPIGFGFEHYDHLGVWRADEEGQSIDASGSIDNDTFDGVHDLATTLLDDPRFRACYVESWRRWGFGTEACADDPGELGIIAPLRELTARSSFTVRTGDGTQGDTAATGQRLTSAEVEAIAASLGEISLGETTPIEFGTVDTLIWLAGFCQNVTVTNTTADPIVWEIRMEVPGNITTNWSSAYSIDGDEHVFVGGTWNADLDGYDSASFGFCALR